MAWWCPLKSSTYENDQLGWYVILRAHCRRPCRTDLSLKWRRKHGTLPHSLPNMFAFPFLLCRRVQSLIASLWTLLPITSLSKWSNIIIMKYCVYPIYKCKCQSKQSRTLAQSPANTSHGQPLVTSSISLKTSTTWHTIWNRSAWNLTDWYECTAFAPKNIQKYWMLDILMLYAVCSTIKYNWLCCYNNILVHPLESCASHPSRLLHGNYWGR